MLNSALAYAAAGRAVFPLLPQKKTPRTSDGFKSATTDVAVITDWFNRWPDSNLGLATGRVSGVAVVDIDGPAGLAWFKKALAEDERPRVFQSTGAAGKFHGIYALPEGCACRCSAGVIAPEVDTRGDGGYIVVAPSIHPSGKKYQLYVRDGAGEKRKVEPTDMTIWASLTPLPRIFWSETMDARTRVVVPPTDASDDAEVVEGQRNAACASRVGAWFARGLGADDVTQLARAWNLRACRPPLEDAEISAVVASIAQGHNQRHPFAFAEDNARARIDAWLLDRGGSWRTQQIDRDLGLSRPADYALRDRVLAALVADGAIKRVDDMSDRYRRVEDAATMIDLSALPAEEREVEVALPLDLNRHVAIKPKNIVVIAGESNSGKSALMLNVAWLNRERGDVRYLTSETSPEELAGRLKMFGTIADWHGKVEFQERSRDFADGIAPNGINIVDFLEISGGEFYRMGDAIREIFDALDKGICFIAIQKKKGAEYGRGAEFTVEKARLALSLHTVGRTPDSAVVRAVCVKAKTFRDGQNIEGRDMFFECVSGKELTSERLVSGGIVKQDGWRWRNKPEQAAAMERVEAFTRKLEAQRDSDSAPADTRYGKD